MLNPRIRRALRNPLTEAESKEVARAISEMHSAALQGKFALRTGTKDVSNSARAYNDASKIVNYLAGPKVLEALDNELLSGPGMWVKTVMGQRAAIGINRVVGRNPSGRVRYNLHSKKEREALELDVSAMKGAFRAAKQAGRIEQMRQIVGWFEGVGAAAGVSKSPPSYTKRLLSIARVLDRHIPEHPRRATPPPGESWLNPPPYKHVRVGQFSSHARMRAAHARLYQAGITHWAYRLSKGGPWIISVKEYNADAARAALRGAHRNPFARRNDGGNIDWKQLPPDAAVVFVPSKGGSGIPGAVSTGTWRWRGKTVYWSGSDARQAQRHLAELVRKHRRKAEKNAALPAGIKLTVKTGDSYDVTLDGEWIGVVGHSHSFPALWYFRNDKRGWFGTVGTQREAVATLHELGTRRYQNNRRARRNGDPYPMLNPRARRNPRLRHPAGFDFHEVYATLEEARREAARLKTERRAHYTDIRRMPGAHGYELWIVPWAGANSGRSSLSGGFRESLGPVPLEERYKLMQTKVTLDGLPAEIAGAKQRFAVVRTTDLSRMAEWSWEAVKRIIEKGGAFRTNPLTRRESAAVIRDSRRSLDRSEELTFEGKTHRAAYHKGRASGRADVVRKYGVRAARAVGGRMQTRALMNAIHRRLARVNPLTAEEVKKTISCAECHFQAAGSFIREGKMRHAAAELGAAIAHMNDVQSMAADRRHARAAMGLKQKYLKVQSKLLGRSTTRTKGMQATLFGGRRGVSVADAKTAAANGRVRRNGSSRVYFYDESGNELAHPMSGREPTGVGSSMVRDGIAYMNVRFMLSLREGRSERKVTAADFGNRPVIVKWWWPGGAEVYHLVPRKPGDKELSDVPDAELRGKTRLPVPRLQAPRRNPDSGNGSPYPPTPLPPSGAITLSGPEQIAAGRMIALKGALRLELVGLKKRGRSAYSIIKEEFGLKGSKQAVFDQFKKMVEDVIAHRAKPPGFNPRRRRARRNPHAGLAGLMNKREAKRATKFA